MAVNYPANSWGFYIVEPLVGLLVEDLVGVEAYKNPAIDKFSRLDIIVELYVKTYRRKTPLTSSFLSPDKKGVMYAPLAV